MSGGYVGQGLERCRRVSAGAEALKPLFAANMPFTGEDLSGLPIVEQAGATAFIKRFEQLQDLLARVVRAIASVEGASTEMTMRDIGDWLEKRFASVDAPDWMTAARIRNRLVHEYPIDEEEQVRRLNESWATMPLLQRITAELDRYVGQKGLQND